MRQKCKHFNIALAPFKQEMGIRNKAHSKEKDFKFYFHPYKRSQLAAIHFFDHFTVDPGDDLTYCFLELIRFATSENSSEESLKPF